MTSIITETHIKKIDHKVMNGFPVMRKVTVPEEFRSEILVDLESGRCRYQTGELASTDNAPISDDDGIGITSEQSRSCESVLDGSSASFSGQEEPEDILSFSSTPEECIGGVATLYKERSYREGIRKKASDEKFGSNDVITVQIEHHPAAENEGGAVKDCIKKKSNMYPSLESIKCSKNKVTMPLTPRVISFENLPANQCDCTNTSFVGSSTSRRSTSATGITSAYIFQENVCDKEVHYERYVTNDLNKALEKSVQTTDAESLRQQEMKLVRQLENSATGKEKHISFNKSDNGDDHDSEGISNSINKRLIDHSDDDFFENEDLSCCMNCIYTTLNAPICSIM